MMSTGEVLEEVPADLPAELDCSAKFVPETKFGALVTGRGSKAGAAPAPDQRLFVPVTPWLFDWMYGCAEEGWTQMLFVKLMPAPA